MENETVKHSNQRESKHEVNDVRLTQEAGEYEELPEG